MGTIINSLAVIIGGVCGLLFGNRLKESCQETLMGVTGVCVMFLGIAGALEKMMTIENNHLVSGQSMLIIGSLAIGALIGEFLDIEGAMERFGAWLKIKTRNEKDASFIEGFVNTSLTICVGAMAVVGSIQDGIYGDYSTLVAKAVLDLIIVVIMTTSMGKGCIFSAIPILLFQGSITILARFIEPLMNETALNNLSLVGSIMIFCVGVNLLWGKKVKVANLLPGLLIAVAASFI